MILNHLPRGSSSSLNRLADERKRILEAAGGAVGQIRAELCDEIGAAFDKHGARITALEQQRGVSCDAVELSSSRMIRKIKDNAA